MPLSKESIGVLEQLKSNGTPCRYVMLTRASKVTSLVVYRKGSQEQAVAEAKKLGTGTPACGVADGKGMALSFKLLRADGWETAPIKDSVLREYIEENAKLKTTSTIDIVEMLPFVDFRTRDEWNAVLAAIKAATDPQARAKALADAVRDVGAEHKEMQKLLAANPQWPQAKETQATITEVVKTLNQLKGTQPMATQPAAPQPAAPRQAAPQPAPQARQPAPQLAPAQRAQPVPPAAAPASPVRPQATTPPRQAAPQPAAAQPAQAAAAAASPAPPVRPRAATPPREAAKKSEAAEIVDKISEQLKPIFGSAERQKMLTECQADANSEFGRVVAALPAGGLPYEQTVAGYEKSRQLAQMHLKSHRRRFMGLVKPTKAEEKVNEHCRNIVSTINYQLETITLHNDAATDVAKKYQGLARQNQPVSPDVATDLLRLADQPLISMQTRKDLRNASGSIYDPHWTQLIDEVNAIKSRAIEAGDVLTIQAKATGQPGDQKKADEAKLIASAITRAQLLSAKGNCREAIDIFKEAIRLAKDMDANVATAKANPSAELQEWEKLNVRGLFEELKETNNLDGAADPAIGKTLEKSLKELESGNPQAAVATAKQVSATDLQAARGKHEAAREACAAYGDLATLVKKTSQTTYAISVSTKDEELAKKARSFGAFGGAKESFDKKFYIKAENQLKQDEKELAQIRVDFRKVRGPQAKQDFDQRAKSGVGGTEQKIVAGIGEEEYLEMLSLAESITEINGFDVSSLSKDEIAAIYGYTTEDFNKINPLLRDTKPKHLNDQQWAKLKTDYGQYTDSVIAGLNKLKGFSGDAVRGTTLPDAVLKKMESEKKFSDKAFLSTSYGHGFAGPHQILIRAKGKNGKDVSNFSIFKDTEQEVLFMPGTEFRVVQIVDFPNPKPHKLLHTSGKLLIELEEA